MDDDVYSRERSIQSLSVADIPDEVGAGGRESGESRICLPHLVLLEPVSANTTISLCVTVALQHVFDKLSAE